MINFNGTDLTDIAPVKIDDIRVSPITLNVTARQRPVTWGQEFVRTTGASRTVAITFAILDMDKDERYNYISDIYSWARVGEIHPLYLPMIEGKHLEVSCTALPEPSYRMWWESKLRLTFTTFNNPFWTADTETKVSCNQDFTVGGNAPPLMRIERTLSGAMANQSYSAGDENMLFTTVPAGNLVIDLNNQNSAVSGTNIDHYLTVTSQYITPKTGTQRIRGSGSVVYSERWI